MKRSVTKSTAQMDILRRAWIAIAASRHDDQVASAIRSAETVLSSAPGGCSSMHAALAAG